MRIALSLLLVYALAACSSSGPINTPTELESLETGLKVDRLWRASTSSSDKNLIYDRLTPVILDSRLYSASAKGTVYAFDLKKGKKQWKQSLKETISGGLGGNSQAVFVGTAKGEVIALARSDGRVLWRAKVSSEILAPPAATLTHIIVRSGDGNVFALNAENGDVLWRYRRSLPALSLRGDSVPVIDGDNVLIGTADGRLLALSLFDGAVLWESTIVAPQGRTDLERMVDVDATPVVAGDKVYAVAHQGRVVAISKLTGTLVWDRDIGSAAGLAVDRHHVYVVDDSDQVWALDRDNGASLWKQDKLKYRDLSAPVRVKDAVVVGDFEGYLHWLSLEDGDITARHHVDDEGVRVAPYYLDGVLYVRSKAGKIEALKLKQQ